MLLAVVGLAPLVKGHSARWWILGGSAFCITLALAFPTLFAPANRHLSRFGAWLYYWAVNAPITALIFYGVVTPVAVVARMLGRNALQLRFDAAAESYWIQRRPPGPEHRSMSPQF